MNIEANLIVKVPELKQRIREYRDYSLKALTKYRDIDKRSVTLMQLRNGRTIGINGSRGYVGKGRVLSNKVVELGITKLLKKKEDEALAEVKKAEKAELKKAADQAKAARDAEYQAMCDAALMAGLPRPKKPRAPRKPKEGPSTTSTTMVTQAPPAPAEIAESMGDPVAWADDLEEVEVNKRMRLLRVREFFEV